MGTTTFTGPVTVGNVVNSDGTGNLAYVGGSDGTANVGYVVMAQSQVVDQNGSPVTNGVYVTNIVIPAQSQVTSMDFNVLTTWDGSQTLGIGTTANATYFTAADAVTLNNTGSTVVGPNSDSNGNWVNVHDQDVQIMLTSSNTGGGTAVLTVFYLQSINI